MNSERQKRADRWRGSARERGYTARWDREAKRYRQEHPLCLGCQASGVITATEVVDHVVPHKGDQALFWDEDNWQPACRWHHDVVKARLEEQYAAGSVLKADLRLDSKAAQAIARQQPRREAVGLDGWPVPMGRGGRKSGTSKPRTAAPPSDAKFRK